jgi:hypothetical protein
MLRLASGSVVYLAAGRTTKESDGTDCRIDAMRKYAGWPAMRTGLEAIVSIGPRGKQPRGRRDRSRR